MLALHGCDAATCRLWPVLVEAGNAGHGTPRSDRSDVLTFPSEAETDAICLAGNIQTSGLTTEGDTAAADTIWLLRGRPAVLVTLEVAPGRKNLFAGSWRDGGTGVKEGVAGDGGEEDEVVVGFEGGEHGGHGIALGEDAGHDSGAALIDAASFSALIHPSWVILILAMVTII